MTQKKRSPSKAARTAPQGTQTQGDAKASVDAAEKSSVPAGMQPTALTVAELVRLMQRAGSRTISEESVRKDLGQGAPVNPDGTLHLLHYSAWLARSASG